MNFGFNTPFAEQLEFFRAKLNLPTERWDDIVRAAHDRAFIVAGAAKADLLNDFQQAMFSRMADGRGLEAFRKDFRRIVETHGWTNWTGEGSKRGEAWRTKVIYQTNMATSYAAGRYKQLTDPEFLKLRPYWRYVHQDGVLHPRPLHRQWGLQRLTLRHDHPFWKTHFPPNGWGCHCRVTPVDGAALGDATIPPEDWDAINPKTGAPMGIDKGFDYAPGASVSTPLQRFIDQKLVNLDAPIGAAMAEALGPALAKEEQIAWFGMVNRVAETLIATGETRLAHTVAPATVQALADRNVKLANAAIWLRDTELLHALRETKTNRAATLSLDVWQNLREHLNQATPYLDTVDESLIYVFDAGDGLGKVVVRVNYRDKGRFDGVRELVTSNFIRTGGMVDPVNVDKDARYLKLGGVSGARFELDHSSRSP